MCAAWRKPGAIEFVKFASVGALNTVVGLAIIYGLKWGLAWGDAAANLLGYLFCIGLGFYLNGRWTFAVPDLRARHLIGYFAVAGAAYLMNLLAVLTSMALLGMTGDVAQLVGVPAFTLTSYVLNKVFVFSKGANRIESLRI
jgi:putative flippase GtrA